MPEGRQAQFTALLPVVDEVADTIDKRASNATGWRVCYERYGRRLRLGLACPIGENPMRESRNSNSNAPCEI